MATREACSAFASVADVEEWGCGCDIDFDDPDDQALVQEKLDLASDVMVRLSGHRFRGQCTVVEYPCRESCVDCTPCGCCVFDALPTHMMLSEILYVKIDGVTQVHGVDYEILGGWQLVRTPDPTIPNSTVRRRWPGCGDHVELSYVYGPPVTSLERDACIELTCELLRDCRPGGRKSRIPGATNLSGGGVAVTVREQAQVGEGLLKVGRFIDYWNPSRTQIPSVVWSPEANLGWSHISIS